MTNAELKIRLSAAILNERKQTNEILQLINLALERNLHLIEGYPSMFAWLVNGFGYSESAAYRRIAAAKVVHSVPGAAAKIETGELNLSNLTSAGSAFRAQEKISKQKVSIEEKRRAVESLQGKSRTQAEQILFSLFPETVSAVKNERLVTVDQNTSRLSVNLPDEVVQDLARIRDLLGHIHPGATYAQIIARIAKEYLQRKDLSRTSAAKKTRVKDAGQVTMDLH